MRLQLLLQALLATFAVGQYGGTPTNTANDVVNRRPCRANILLFARGQTEAGNLGSAVGGPFRTELERVAPGRFLYQGVNYPVNVVNVLPSFDKGNVGGGEMRRQVNQSVALCPNARIFLGGYSYGGMAVHWAFNRTIPEYKAKIGGIVTFGDPFINQTFAGIDEAKVKMYCNAGDTVCEGPTWVIRPPHLFYTTNNSTKKGAQFMAGLAA